MTVLSPYNPGKCPNAPRSRPQGPGHIVRDLNEPKIVPKLPGVGFWHALARWGQACARPVRCCWEQKKLNSAVGEMIYSLESI